MKKGLRTFALCLAFAMTCAATTFAQTTAPQGRLTLTFQKPVMTSDVVGTNTVYYTPYVGYTIPIYNGSAFTTYNFVYLQLTLNSTYQTAGNLYDVYVFLNSVGGLAIGAGPAWSSTTSRGTSVDIEYINGILVNSNAITAYNDTTSYSISFGRATYLGTIYVPAGGSGGQTTVQFKPSSGAAGGNGNVIGLYNAYNRVSIDSISRDTAVSWTNSSPTWVEADSGASSPNNRITWVDGLKQTPVRGRYAALVEGGGTFPSAPAIGINLDATSGTPNVISAIGLNSSTNWIFELEAEESFTPQLGLHYLQAMESVGGATGATATFFGDAPAGQFQSLILHGEY